MASHPTALNDSEPKPYVSEAPPGYEEAVVSNSVPEGNHALDAQAVVHPQYVTPPAAPAAMSSPLAQQSLLPYQTDQFGKPLNSGIYYQASSQGWYCFFRNRNGRAEFRDGLGNVLFFIEPMPSAFKVYMNSVINGQPGLLQECYLPMNGGTFEATIVVAVDGFHVSFDGTEIVFPHRVHPEAFQGMVMFVPGIDTYVPPDREIVCCNIL